MKRISCYNIRWEDERDERWKVCIKGKVIQGIGILPCIKLSPCRSFIVYVGPEHEIIIWDLMKKRVFLKFAHHVAWISDHLVNSEMSLLVVGSFDKTMTLWDLENKKLKKIVECSSYVYSVSINENSSLAAAACSDGSFHLYSIEDGSVRVIKGIHKFHVVTFFIRGNDRILSFGNDHLIIHWNIENKEDSVVVYRGKDKMIDAYNLAFRYCVVAFQDFYFKVFKLKFKG